MEWLRKAKLSGVRVKRVDAPTATFEKHDASFDLFAVADAKAPAVWARHYEIGTEQSLTMRPRELTQSLTLNDAYRLAPDFFSRLLLYICGRLL